MAFVWIAAGVSKIGDRLAVTQNIQAYDIFTPAWSDILAQLIGPAELIGGLLLLFGLWLRPASKVAIGVLVLFIVGIGQAWLRGLELNCGCFTPDEAITNYQLQYFGVIVRDLVFIALSAWTIWRPFTKLAVRP
ncbi:MauE/DoxX family redox-associated membrane protein [Corynebacterium uterequi]